MSERPFFRVRQGIADDYGFILETWQFHFRRTVAGRDHGHNYLVEQKRLIRRVLGRPSTELRIACSWEDANAIHGYAVLEKSASRPRIYFVYVRDDSRRLGMATQLLLDMTRRACVFTHRPCVQAIERAVPQWCYSYFANFEDEPLGSSYMDDKTERMLLSRAPARTSPT